MNAPPHSLRDTDFVNKLKSTYQGFDEIVHSLTSFDQKHNLAGLSKAGNEFGGRMCPAQIWSVLLPIDEFVHLRDRAVEDTNFEAVVKHVEDQILAHNG